MSADSVEESRSSSVRRTSGRSAWIWWVLIGVVSVAGIAVGWGGSPTTGTGNDRLFSLSEQMKCLQCTGESVANSQAPIAIEMRDEIERQMSRGQSNDEILTYFVDRYGQRVLLNPASSGLGAIIWILPVVVVAVGIAVIAARLARQRAPDVADLDPEDDALVRQARTVGGPE